MHYNKLQQTFCLQESFLRLWGFDKGLREGPAKTNLIEEYSIFDMDLRWSWGT